MTINMANMHKAFSVPDFRKLLKIIRLDWQHQDELLEKLKSYLQKRIGEFESTKGRYQECKKKEAAAMNMLATGKLPNGVSITDEGLSRLHSSIREYRILQREFEREEKENTRIIKKLEKYLSIMK